jgi:hypothetical protein
MSKLVQSYPIIYRIQDVLTGTDSAFVIKGVMVGENPDGDYIDFGATLKGNQVVSLEEIGDISALDSFNRLRVSNPYTIFDSKQLYDKQPLLFDENTGGSATSVHSTTHSRVRMTVTASASDYVIRQTKQRFNYQPGKSSLIFFTFLGDQDSGVIKRAGFFDGTGANYLTPNNGIFLQIDENDISWNICKNGSTTETVTQQNWNKDVMDGTGSSGINLDFGAVQLGVIDFEYLGTGTVRVGFVIDKKLIYVHHFNHSNDSSFTSVYMSTPNQPIRYDIQSDGTGEGYFDHICSTSMSEGGVEETGVTHTIDTENTHLDADTADTPYVLLALRLKTTHLDLTIIPSFISMISETNDDFRWSIHLNPTYNGSLSYGDITNSGCQYAAGATANDITAQGLKTDAGYAKSNFAVDFPIKSLPRLGSQIDGTRDELILAVTPLSSNADIQGSLTFKELL